MSLPQADRETSDVSYPRSGSAGGAKLNALKPSEPFAGKLMSHIAEMRMTASTIASRLSRHADSLGTPNTNATEPGDKEGDAPNNVADCLSALERELKGISREVDRLFV